MSRKLSIHNTGKDLMHGRCRRPSMFSSLIFTHSKLHSLPSIYTIILLLKVCLSVSVRKLQVAILARSSREMSLTVRIVCSTSSHEFVCQIGLAFVLYAKNTQYLWETGPLVPVFISMASERPAIVTSGAVRHGWLAQTLRIAICRRQCGGGGACVRAFARAWCVCNNIYYTIIIFDPGW